MSLSLALSSRALPLFIYSCVCYTFYIAVKRILSPLRHIPGPRSESWFKGNLGQIFDRKGLSYHHDLVDWFGGIVKIYGFFGDEQLYVTDPRALHSILLDERDAFEETYIFLETNKLIFGPGLVATKGDQHKRQRKLASQVFSVSQLRESTPVFYDVAIKLANVIVKESKMREDSILDMSEWISRVALESVGQTLIGYSFDPLDSKDNNPYTSAIKELIPTLFSLSLFRQFAPFLLRLGPPSFRRRLVEITPIRAIQRVKDMSDVMYDTARRILRRKMDVSSESDEVSSRPKDIISALLHANSLSTQSDRMNESELIGQMTTFIFGAHDTTSSALSRILYMLSTHDDVQEKVRQEIDAAMITSHDGYAGYLNYNEVTSLPWLDAVIKETLRLHPPVPFVRRTALRETVIPLSQPIKEFQATGSPISNVTVPIGTTIFLGIAGANRLESIWGPDAKEWKPERWVTNNPETPHARDASARLPGIYAGMMSFLGGSRSCVGYKFAQVEMKIILVVLLSRFTFSPTEDEICWNLSQIISPSVIDQSNVDSSGVAGERKGLPLVVRARG